MSDRDSIIYQAKLAEQAERYEDMVAKMKIIATVSIPLLKIQIILQILIYLMDF
jgi:hypothetical protein